jgi:hypothetical protein
MRIDTGEADAIDARFLFHAIIITKEPINGSFVECYAVCGTVAKS